MAVPTLSLALPARRCAHGDTHRRADEVVDPPAAIDWYIKYLGATKAAPPFGVAFGRTQIAVVRTDTRQPSEGSVIDHIGLSFPDVRARITELAAGGARVVTPITDAPGLFAYG